MKKLLTISLVLLLCASAFGVPRDKTRNTIGDFAGANVLDTGYGDNIKAALDLIRDELDGAGTGVTIYVDSDETTGTEDGTSWETAYDTVNEAIDVTIPERFDVIKCAPGHAETITTASAIVLDISGVTIKGYGRGTLMPTFSVTSSLNTYDPIGLWVSASNCAISNLKFTSASGAKHQIVVADAGDNFEIDNCYFEVPSAASYFQPSIIDIREHANGVVIKNSTFDIGIEDGSDMIASGIVFSTVSSIRIENNTMFGDYHACINGSKESDEVFIIGNTLYNGTMEGDGQIHSEPVIVLANSTSGLIAHNDAISSAGAQAMILADDCTRFMNKIHDDDGDEYTGTYEGIYGNMFLLESWVASSVSD